MLDNFKFQFDKLPSTFSKWKNRFQDDFANLWDDSAAAFVKGTADQVHVDTGMTAASLIPLANKVGGISGVLGAISLRRHISVPDYNHNPLATTSLGIVNRDVMGGQRLGTEWNINYGSRVNLVYSLEYRVNVGHWEILEHNWKALDEGVDRFRVYFNANVWFKVHVSVQLWLDGKL
jgi:hypothetical protein